MGVCTMALMSHFYGSTFGINCHRVEEGGVADVVPTKIR